MAVMRWTFKNLYDRFNAKAYQSPGEAQLAEGKETVNDGYLMWASEYEWTCLRQTSTRVLPVYKNTETPANVEINDVFKITLADGDANSYQISFTATAASVSNVVAGLYAAGVAAAAAGHKPWNLVALTNDTTHLTIRSSQAGLVLTVTTSTTDGGGANTQTLTDAKVANDGIVPLPADFGELTDDPILVTSGYYTPPRLEQRTPEWISDHVETARRTPGVPLYYAVQEAIFAGTVGSRRELVVYPWPNADYTLNLPYRIEVATMTADAEYPVGAAAHGPTILAAAFALWEERTGKTDGVMHKLYDRALARSIRRDSQQRAKVLGFTPPERGAPERVWQPVTYES